MALLKNKNMEIVITILAGIGIVFCYYVCLGIQERKKIDKL